MRPSFAIPTFDSALLPFPCAREMLDVSSTCSGSSGPQQASKIVAFCRLSSAVLGKGLGIGVVSQLSPRVHSLRVLQMQRQDGEFTFHYSHVGVLRLVEPCPATWSCRFFDCLRSSCRLGSEASEAEGTIDLRVSACSFSLASMLIHDLCAFH